MEMKSVSVIIPAYREEEHIGGTVSDILESFRKKSIKFEIIAVIDTIEGDKTFEIVDNLSKTNKEIIIIKREGKQGVASGIREGIKKASNDITIIVMADKSENSDDILNLVLKMNDGYDMVFGSRFLEGATVKEYSKKKFIASRLCNFAIRILFNIKSKDITNAVKAYKTSILKNINITSTGFEIFAELPIKAYTGGFKNFKELPLSHTVRKESISKLNLSKEGKRYFKMILICYIKKLFHNNNL